MTFPLRSALLALMASLALGAHATIYYVSPTGNDAANGTSQTTAWRTIDRVNQVIFSLLPGDQILFQRGGTYRGKITQALSGTSGNPIRIGDYGTGALPIIKGSKVISGWTQYSGNIWKVSVSDRVDQVYVSGTRMTLARYPNTGWLRNSQGSGFTMQSSDLTQASGYWNGARAVLRSMASVIDTLRVSNYAGGTLTFTTMPTNVGMGTDPWGFFLCNKLNLLDSPGEWFYDKAAQILYFWAPNNVDPNTLTIEASVYDCGIYYGLNAHDLRVENISFKHQRLAGVQSEGATLVTVNGCAFEDCFHGIRSGGGGYNTFSNNTFHHTYATALFILEHDDVASGNTMTAIAMIPGEGETAWGYFGVRSIGSNNIIRSNVLDTIGYTGMEVNANALVEKNVVKHPLATLNDGGCIAFDLADGITIQDNIVMDPIGQLNGSATNMPNYQPLGVGIYFGNTSIKNATVQRNTVKGVIGTGIHVDHNMTSVNLRVTDNVLYNNTVGITVSDYSNDNGAGAVPPYFVANFNDVYSNNTVYALTKDQLCLRFYNKYSDTPVDFGTFTNNRLFNPFNELSIFVYNLYNGNQRYYTLERWQQERNEEQGSTRSPLRQASFTTTSELTGNLVVNGGFDSNVTGWGGWPTNAQVTRVTTNLDNGCLKAYLPNNSLYNSFTLRNPDWYAVENGQWYRMKFSIQSTAEGDLIAGLKGQTQLTNPYTIAERQIPFGTERRDLELYFQSTLTDQALVQFVNQYTEPLYYLDNVDLRKVAVQAVDPTVGHKLYYNDQATAQSFTLPAGCWSDVGGNIIQGSFTVQPYGSKIYFKVADSQCTVQPTTGSVAAKVFLGGALNWTTGIMRDDLRAAGLVPNAEPYTALGYTLENTGATVSSAIMNASGNSAVVDWVLLELRNNDGSYSLAGRRAALVRKDGVVIGTDGSTTITFNTASVGKYLVVSHRNHMGAMASAAITTNGQQVDMTSLATGIYGVVPEQTDGVRYALWPGNVNGDSYVKYTGTSNDRDPVLTAVGGTVPTATITGYRREDVNMDGVVKYTGANNDRDPILTVVGATIPTATRYLQVP